MSPVEVKFSVDDVVVLDRFPEGVLPVSGRIGFHKGPCQGVVDMTVLEGARTVRCRKWAMHGCQFCYEVTSIPVTENDLKECVEKKQQVSPPMEAA